MRAAIPREAARPLRTGVTQPFAQRFVIRNINQRLAPQPDVERIVDVAHRIATDFGQRRRARTDDRRSTRHRLECRQSESFVRRRYGDGKRAAVEIAQLQRGEFVQRDRSIWAVAAHTHEIDTWRQTCTPCGNQRSQVFPDVVGTDEKHVWPLYLQWKLARFPRFERRTGRQCNHVDSIEGYVKPTLYLAPAEGRICENSPSGRSARSKRSLLRAARARAGSRKCKWSAVVDRGYRWFFRGKKRAVPRIPDDVCAARNGAAHIETGWAKIGTERTQQTARKEISHEQRDRYVVALQKPGEQRAHIHADTATISQKVVRIDGQVHRRERFGPSSAYYCTMIRVGVDAWNLPGDRRGVGRYVRAILGEWSRAFSSRVEVTLIVPEWHTWTVRKRYLREVENRPYRVVSRGLHRRARLDVLWFPFNGCSWSAFSQPAVATLHDASNFVLPNTMPQMQELFRTAAARCHALITDSKFSQRELARVLALPLDALTPIPLGVEPPRPPEPTALNVEALRPYVLFVGTSDRRKGLDVLCRAMTRVERNDPSLRLVIAGERTDHIPGLDGALVEPVGYVDDTSLAALYRRAELLAFPSLYEGFGLPILEAMSYGTPVVATNTSAIPEVGGDAAFYVDPGDEKALAEAIRRVRNDAQLAASLRERGLVRAAATTWTKTAAATLDVLERAAK